MSKPAKKKAAKRAAPKKKAASKKKAPSRRRNNPTPIVLVNPSPGGRTVAKKKAKKKAPAKQAPAKRAPAKRKNPSSPPAKKAPRRRRRRNPSTSWGRAAMGTGAGALGGLALIGTDMGVGMIPIPEWGKAAATAGLGLAGSTVAAKLGAPSLGAGFAGASAVMTAARIKLAYSIGQAAKETESAPPQVTAVEAGRVFTDEAGRVFKEEAGRLVAIGGAKALPAKQLQVPSLKEAGRLVNVAGPPMRLTGPHSWATKRYVSAHNR